MVEVFACRLEGDMKMESLLPLVSAEKQDIVRRIRDLKEKRRLLVGDLLTRCTVSRKTGVAGRDIRFSANEWGKPAAEGISGLHFNISHSGNWVVCAVDSFPVGVDVEEAVPIDYPGIAERYFSPAELDDLVKKDPVQRQDYFYQLWTAKESYVKALGTGLTTPLSTFTVKSVEGEVSMAGGPHAGKVFFRQYDLEPGYLLTACSFGSAFCGQIQILSLESLSVELKGTSAQVG